jgi:hypothetical protein
MGQQQVMELVATEEKGGGTLRRTFLVLALAVLMAAMMAVGTPVALAAPNGQPGPNSFEPAFDKGGAQENFNFGHCQSGAAQQPGPASSTKDGNPSRNDGSASLCPPAS